MKKYYAYLSDSEVFETSKDLNIVNCGYNTTYSDGIHYMRRRPDFYLIFLSSGSGTYILNGKRYKLKEGNMFLYYPDDLQEYIYSNNDSSLWYWVHFNGKKSFEIMEKLNLFSGPVYPEFTDKIFKLYDKIVNEYKSRNPFYEESAEALLRQLLIETARSRILPSRTKDFSKVIEAIVANPTVSNDECAKMCNLSTVHFIRLFKEIYETTPHKFKQKVIIDQAKDLLLNTDKTITSISETLGFDNNPLYFNKLFKTVTGMYPTEFRSKFKIT